MLERIAPKIGAQVVLEPEWRIAGQITFKNGRRSYFRYNTLDLNPVGASDIAKDKAYAEFFMARMGYPVVPATKTFYSAAWAKAIGRPNRSLAAAITYAKRLGLPVVVKPNSGSQGSRVSVVRRESDLSDALQAAFAVDKVVLVQRQVRGRDYRLVVLDSRIVSAYERIPLNVVGDGRTDVDGLIRRRQREFRLKKRDTRISLDDVRTTARLRHLGLATTSVIEPGRQVFLLDNANLSTGGDAVDVTHRVHPEFRNLAVALTRDMGLRLCGVDLMVDGDIQDPVGRYWVLEINAAPGLDHYVKTGIEQERLVEDLYLQVLKHLEREPAAMRSGSRA